MNILGAKKLHTGVLAPKRGEIPLAASTSDRKFPRRKGVGMTEIRRTLLLEKREKH